jgi:hypothetical protein
MTIPQRPIPRATPFARALPPAVLALICATSLSARDYAVRNIGDWSVTASKDGQGCFLTRDYDENDGTTLLLGLDIDGTNRLTVLNANWSIKPKERLKLNFRLSNSSYPAHFAVGMAADGKQGFVTSFGAKFPSYFATSRSLDIARGTVPVARLGLDGAAAAIAELKHCVDGQQAKPAATTGGKTRSGDIPKDPFARDSRE